MISRPCAVERERSVYRNANKAPCTMGVEKAACSNVKNAPSG